VPISQRKGGVLIEIKKKGKEIETRGYRIGMVGSGGAGLLKKWKQKGGVDFQKLGGCHILSLGCFTDGGATLKGAFVIRKSNRDEPRDRVND